MNWQIKYLISLRAIRERANIVGNATKSGNLSHFELREDKLDDVVDLEASIIKVGAQDSLMAFGLERLEPNVLAEGFQVSDDNAMLGIDSHVALLKSLGRSLLVHPDVFGTEGHPGHLVGKAIVRLLL
ncbi:hypothetical protein NHQ30_011669 [Ciborinia camelliae]|nr:hypothetical protein NHQ30_011669 [Ciborinia camelliae]